MIGLYTGMGLSTRQAAAAAVADVNAETTAWAAVTSPTAPRRALVDTMITALKVDGTWTVLDRLGFAGANEATSTVCLKNPAKLFTFNGTYTFVADRYWQGDGVNGYISFVEAPNAVGNSFAQDAASFGFGIKVEGVAVTVQAMGQVGGATLLHGGARLSAGNETFRINDATGSTAQAWPSTRLGRRAYSRTSSLIKRAFYNGVRTADLSVASTSLGVQPLAMGRSVAVYTDPGFNFWWSGGGMTDAQVATLDAAAQTFMTAIGSA